MASPVHVDLYTAGNNVTPAFSYDVTTDQDGVFIINNAPMGIFTMTAKNSHTLQSVKTLQSITPGNNFVNFGLLLEGMVIVIT
jgi:hypothetical protein